MIDLLNNKENFEKEGKDLLEINKSSKVIKDTTKKMAQDLDKQKGILENIEENVIKDEENDDKDKEEINRANSMPRRNKKKSCCKCRIIWIILISIDVILAIVFSITL